MTKLVTVKEVVSHFLASNEAKDNTIVTIIKSANPDKRLKTLLNKYLNLSHTSLFSLVKNKGRLQMFNQHSWTIKKLN
jgi:hypothetical protein